MKPHIKLYFVNMWPSFNLYDNDFTRTLSPHFDLEITNKNPDFLVYSIFGDLEIDKFDCPRIFYSAENRLPDFWECDYGISFHYIYHKRYLRYPNFKRRLIGGRLEGLNESFYRTRSLDEIIQSKTKFCNFLVSHSGPQERLRFFHKLRKYKHVDSGGHVLNNIGNPIGYSDRETVDFYKPYKFNICFENSSSAGYTTEKIVHAMFARTIPIYWGDPFVTEYFNPKSFINVHDYKSYDEVIEHVIEIDQNEALHRQYLSEPYIFMEEKEFIEEQLLLNFFKYVFSKKGKVKPIARRSLFEKRLNYLSFLLTEWVNRKRFHKLKEKKSNLGSW